MFHSVLKDIFMESGAAIIEREVARRLLENVRKENHVEGRRPRSWFQLASSNRKASRPVSKKEKEVLRHFLAPAPPRRGHLAKERLEATAIDLTAASFAYAFKKGI